MCHIPRAAPTPHLHGTGEVSVLAESGESVNISQTLASYKAKALDRKNIFVRSSNSGTVVRAVNQM